MQVSRLLKIVGSVAGVVGAVAGAAYGWQQAKWPGLALTTDTAALDEKFTAQYQQLAGDLKEAFEKSERRADGFQQSLLFRDREIAQEKLFRLEDKLVDSPNDPNLKALIRSVEREIQLIDRQIEELQR